MQRQEDLTQTRDELPRPDETTVSRTTRLLQCCGSDRRRDHPR
jgi:hypothetical protein